mmetsp:Transcript_29328/g.96489  ORF Transcript_29328/g.96489 Transcript_29328/m.96489 type:complete len:419 (-) Transcript_29328:1198-2454(-)
MMKATPPSPPSSPSSSSSLSSLSSSSSPLPSSSLPVRCSFADEPPSIMTADHALASVRPTSASVRTKLPPGSSLCRCMSSMATQPPVQRSALASTQRRISLARLLASAPVLAYPASFGQTVCALTRGRPCASSAAFTFATVLGRPCHDDESMRAAPVCSTTLRSAAMHGALKGDVDEKGCSTPSTSKRMTLRSASWLVSSNASRPSRPMGSVPVEASVGASPASCATAPAASPSASSARHSGSSAGVLPLSPRSASSSVANAPAPPPAPERPSPSPSPHSPATSGASCSSRSSCAPSVTSCRCSLRVPPLLPPPAPAALFLPLVLSRSPACATIVPPAPPPPSAPPPASTFFLPRSGIVSVSRRWSAAPLPFFPVLSLITPQLSAYACTRCRSLASSCSGLRRSLEPGWASSTKSSIC